MSADKDNKKDEKIILKRDYYPGGIDISLSDYTATHTVPIAVTKVTVPIYKKGTQSFIGTYEGMNKGDVFETGDYGILYRVIKFVKITDEGRIFRIKRVDDNFITSLDINGSNKGDKVLIKTRTGIKDGMFNYPK